MDKKLLDALSNLSIGLEYLAQAIQDGNRSKTATAKALSGGDLDKKIISLQKSVEDIISSNKIILKTQEKLVQILRKQTQEVKSVESNPIKYGEAPTLPELAKIEDQIIPLKYGKAPTLPKMAKIGEQTIPLKYGKVPTLPKMAKIGEQTIPLKYGDVPTLPKLADIPIQVIPLQYGTLPNQPTIPAIPTQEIPLQYGTLPNQPTIPAIPKQIIGLEYENIGKFIPPQPDKVIIPTEYGEPSNKNKITKAPKNTVEKQGKENDLFDRAGDGQRKQGIKDGVGMIMLIAVAVLAIGMAFKLIGGIDIGTVLSLSIAIPLLALAFAKVSTYKELTMRRAIELTGVMVALATALVLTSVILRGVAPVGLVQIMSAIGIAGVFTVLGFGLGQLIDSVQGMGGNVTKSLFLLPIIMPAISLAILLSSYILSAVSPIGMPQIVSSIAIAGVFFVLGYGIKSLVDGVSGLGAGSLKALALMPIVLTALSLSIMLSSYLLSAVAPVGLPQLFTAIAIAGVFTVLSYGLGQIFKGLSSFGMKSLILLPFLPLILVSLSLSIALSSYVLAMVRPVGILQLFTAIMIAGVFAVIGFGLGKLLNGMKELKNPALAAVIAAALPILLVAIAGAITASSFLFSKIKPINFAQFLTAVGISIIFIPISFALPFISKAISQVSVARIALMPIILVAMATVILLTSEIFAKVVPIPFANLLSITLLSITIAVVSVIFGLVFKFIGSIPVTSIVTGGITMVGIATVIYAVSKILAKGDYTQFPSIEWTLKTALAIGVFGLAMVLLGNAITANPLALPAGLLAVVSLAATIVVTSKILARGDYTTFPSMDWVKGVGASMGVFGLATVTLGSLVVGTLGLGGVALAAGMAAVISLSETIVKVANIFSGVDFSGGPKKEWAEGVGVALGAFSPVYSMMMKNKIFELFGGGGMGPDQFAQSIVTLSTAIVQAADIIRSGVFTGGPKKEWAEGVGIAIGGFSKVYQMLMINGIAKLFGGGGMGPDEFSKAIVTISTAIRDSSTILKSGTYVGAPKKEWAEGVAIAIGGFSKVYQMLLVNGIAKFFGGGGMGPDEFSKAIVAISTAIRESSFILKAGTYVGAPSKEWAEGVAIAIGGFSKVYQMLLVNGIAKFFGGGGMGPDEFSKSIVAISTAIRDSSFILKEGIYQGAPTKEWAEGVAIAIGGFSKVYQMLLTNGIAKFFGGGGMGPDEFSKAIVAISTAIRDSSFILKEGTYQGAPTKEWAEGVSLGIGGFSQVYAMLMKNSIVDMFGGGGIGPEDFSKAIESVSRGLLVASELLSQGTFTGGPTKAWSEGVALGIGGFSQVYSMLMKNSIMKMFDGGGVGPEEFGKAIASVSEGLLVASEILSKGKFVGGPTKAWSEGVAAGIGGFSSVYGMLQTNSIFEFFGAGGLSPKDFSTAIEVISDGIVKSSNILSKGNYVGGPSKKWAEGISLAVGEFSKVYDYLSGNFLTNYFRGGAIDPKTFATAIATVAEGINEAAGKITGPFPKGPSKEWAQGVSIAFGEFSKIYDYMSGDLITNFLRGGGVNADAFVKTIDTVAQGINTAAGRISGPFPKGPTKEWAEGTSLAFGQFSKIYDYMSGDIITNFLRGGAVKPEDFVNTIGIVADGINIASKKISGPFPAGPSKEWAQGMSIAFGEFTKIYDYLSGGFMQRFLTGGAINPQEFVNTINTVAEGVNAASKRIKGPFPAGPSEEWATGVSVAFGEFTKIYDYLSGNFLKRFFGGGGINPDEFVNTINTIADGVNAASKKIQGPFPQGPSKEWAEGMSIALGEFTKIYDFLSGGFIGRFLGTGKVDPEEFVSTISIVADGINMASKKISGPFPQGPSKEWAQGISIAFGEFSKMYDYFKGGWFTDKVDPQQFVDSIGTIADGINTAGGKIKGPFPQGPTKEWAQAISLSFGAFSEIYDYLSASGFWNGLFSSGPKDPTIFAQAIDTVAMGINAASKRIQGPFPLGPSKEWAEGISTSFGAFSKIYDYFGEGFMKDAVDPDEFARAIDTVATGINVASKRIQGPFPEGPSREWAKGTSLAFGEFSKMYSFLDGGFLGSKIEPDDFVYAIETIAEGINTASKKIKGPFPEGPSKEWAKGTSRAFGEFSKIYDYFSGGWFSKPIDADVFSNVINTVADSINIAASKIKGPYGKGPDEVWAKGISRAFGEFSKIYDYFSGSWFTNPIDSDVFNNVIVTVAESMNAAGGKIKGPFAKGPDKEWSKSIAQTFGAFSNIYDYMSGSWFSKPIDADEFQNVIVTVADSITLAASKIKGPFNKGPEKGWADGLAQSFGAFSKIYDYMSGGWFSKQIDPDLFKTVITGVAQAMNAAGSTLKGPWTTGPSIQWSESISKTFGVFTNLYDYFSKGFVNRIIRGTPDPNKFSTDIKNIALAVNVAASTLKGPYTNPPTVEWADGVSRTFGVFTNLYDYFSKGFIGRFLTENPDPTKFSNDIKNIALAVNTAASTLKGPYTNPPSEEWADGVSRSFGVFTNLYDYFSKGFISKFLSGSPDPTKFSTDIATIAAGINTAAVSLKGPYKAPPSKEWSESVSVAFGTFTDIYDYLNDQWLSSDIDPVKFVGTIKTIADGINTAAVSLRGEYKQGPKKEWAEGVSLAFGAFSDIYDYLNDQWLSTNIDPEDFNLTIQTIADGIVTAAKTLGGYSKFPTGPSKTWAEGVSLAFGAFTDIYDYLNDQWFSSDIDPEKFSKTIKTIGSGIKEAAVSLGGAKNYPIGPSETWAKGVSLSFGAFSKIYETLSGGWFTKAIDPEDFSTAINTIAKGIIEAAKTLGGPDAVKSYQSGPPKTWSEGIAASFGAFTGIFNALNKDSSWFSGGKDYDYYGNAIKSVGQGLVDAANLIGGANVSYDVNKLPKKEWSESIKNTMANFIPTLKYISDSGGIFTSGATKLMDNMAAIAGSIKDTSITVSEGNYTTIINKDWYTNLKDTINVFTNAVKTVTALSPDWDMMSKLAESVKEVSEIISAGKYNIIVNKDWSAATKLLFNDFISILKNTKNIPSEDSYNQLRNVSNNLVWVSRILPKGQYKFIVPNSWSSAIKLVIYDFVSILKKVEDLKEDSYNQLRNVVNNVVWASRTIGKGTYGTLIPQEWLSNTKDIFYQFGYILRSISDIGEDSFNTLRNVGNNIVWISRILPRGLYNFSIPNTWTNQIKDTFYRYVNISSIASTIQPKQIQSTRSVASSIQQNSIILSKGKYTTKIPKEYSSSVLEAYKLFAQTLSEMKKAGLLESLTSDLVTKSTIISQVIAGVAQYFNGANVVFDEEKMPSMEWASGFSSTVSALVPGISLIEELSKDKADGGAKFKKNIATITESIVDVATKFSTLKLPEKTKSIPEDYFENIAKAVGSFMDIQRTITGLEAADTTKMLTGLTKLQGVYDKLATTLDKLSAATKNLDLQKLSAINSLSTSVVNLSTINPDSFKQVLNVLETKGAKAMESVSNAKINTAGTTETGKTPISTMMVPTGGSSGGGESSASMDELTGAIQDLRGVLESISGVLGTPDSSVTLVAYMAKKMGANLKAKSFVKSSG